MTTLLVGLDGHSSGERALAHAERQAKLIGDCELIVLYVIEWSPFSFHTAEENAQRHKRREEEIAFAQERVLDPALKQLAEAGVKATGKVLHGDVADTINRVAKQSGAEQIVVGRTSDNGFSQKIFGSVTSNLVMSASVPVTVVA
ncbi:universal stress protein [Aliishimia ponticola]|uniref:Universal stress protein n=1 Tax=Aliishimia ponticola TaxID=2499833 RepID=A0A4S4N8J7_9RHOB|nr:universal stress protein [Aliishimia ponticola]THH34368.1 universal stress protein [Aliishimia ponticola]